MRKLILCAASLLAVACVTGCSARTGQSKPQENLPAEVKAAVMTADAGIKQTVLFADPAGAVDAIYKSLEKQPSLSKVELSDLEKVFGIPSSKALEAVAYVTDAKSGLSDIAVILPQQGAADQVREALIQYRILRADEFKNYDILDAYSIASGAAVFNQGDYVVMLMLADNEDAQAILDQYMPK